MQARLAERSASGAQRADYVWVGVHAEDLVTHLGHPGRVRGTEPPAADDAYPHLLASLQGRNDPLVRMTVIGCGHLGATHAASMAEFGHDVIGVEIDQSKIAILQEGRAWFHEPELDGMLSRHVASGRLRFTTDFAQAGVFGEMHFLAVATPGVADGDDYDLSQIFAAIRSLAPYLTGPCVIVGKSTVPVGTAAELVQRVRGAARPGVDIEVAWNPTRPNTSQAASSSLSSVGLLVVRRFTQETLLRS